MVKKLIRKLTRYSLEKNPNIRVGDLCRHINNDYHYEVIGIYYNVELNAFVFMRDPVNNQIVSFPMREVTTPYTRR